MNRPQTPFSIPSTSLMRASRQRGSSLIEVLIAMLIVAFALLGIAGLQLASVRSQQSASLRSVAVNQIQVMAERIRTNSSALLGAGVTGYIADDAYAAAATIPADPNCSPSAGTCTAAQSAQQDLREWRQALAAELPGGRGALAAVVTGGITAARARTITVMWMEKAQDSDDNLTSAPEDATCPAPRVAGVRCLSMVVSP